RPGHGLRRSALARINRLIVPIVRSPGSQSHVLARASTRINKSQVPQLLPGLEIKIPSLTLRIRPERPAAIRALLPTNPEPPQVFKHRVDKFGPAPLLIQVFIAQDQSTSALGRPLPRKPKRTRVPGVE